MAALKLVNNTGLRSERNLCYVNTELQLLFSIPDVKDFFASKKYRENYPEKLPICDELSRILKTQGQFQTTAAELRRLVGSLYNREDICDGEQQDLEEFHTLLLSGMENELVKVGAKQARFMSKFRGREENKKTFLYTKDGRCIHGHLPRTEQEDFQVIKLDVPSTNRLISLNNLVSNHFAENPNTFSMKCSDCCNHTSNCPRTGKCKMREATSQKHIISAPNLLYIQLLRFEDYQNPKIDTKITPENVLILPNQDKYKLVSIGNHLGTFINNGHYQALIKIGTNWIKADDKNISKTSLMTEISDKNYIFVYRKFSTTVPFVASNDWEEVLEDQPVPPGLHIQLNTNTGKNYGKLLDSPGGENVRYNKNRSDKKSTTKDGITETESDRRENFEKGSGNMEIKKEETKANEDIRNKVTKQLDLSSLDNTNWLNDEVVNEYMRLLNTLEKDAFMFTSFFHTAFRQGGFERVSNYYRKSDPLNYKTLYIPVHQNSHWFLITFSGNELVAYDPYNYPQSNERERKRLLKKNVQDHLCTLKKLENEYFKPLFELKKRSYKKCVLYVKVPPLIPPQNNSCDCGVFLLAMTKCLLLKNKFEMCTDDMVNIRSQMKKELQTGDIDAYMFSNLKNKDRGNKSNEQPMSSLGSSEVPINKKMSRSNFGSTPVPINRDTQKEKDNGKLPRSNMISSPVSKKIASNFEKKSSGMIHDQENIQCFMFNNFGEEIIVETFGNKVTCISCLDIFARIDLHFKKSSVCTEKVEKSTFWDAYNDHKKEEKKMKERLRMKIYRERKKEENAELYKEDQRNQNSGFRDKKKAEDANLFKEKQKLNNTKFRDEKKAEDANLYKEKQKLDNKKFRDEKKAEDANLFKEKQKLDNKKFRDKQINVNMNEYHEKLRSQVREIRIRKEEENQSVYREKLRSQVNRCRNSQKKEDSDMYHMKLRSQIKKFRENDRLDNDELYKMKQNAQKRVNRLSRKNSNKAKYKEKERKEKEDCRLRQKQNWGRIQRLISFRKAVRYGAIFVCSSCHQRMFENGVSAVTTKFKEEVEKKKSGHFDECIAEELILEIHGKQSGSYLCHTCKNTIKKGKIPSMSSKNGLNLREIKDPDTKLTEVENNLIAQNIIFQKIFLLPKSRMSAVKDRLVNVPVGASDVLNTIKSIPRTPREAGLIQVKLKRKLKYQNYHKQEYIDPKKIFKTLELLKTSGHPYYQFYDDFKVYRKRCELEYQRIHHDNAAKNSKKIISVQCVNDTKIPSIINLKQDLKRDAATQIDDDHTLDEEDEYVKNDPVRKFQFHHNISTCLTNKFPEMLINDDGEEIHEHDDFEFAPGEGKIPKNILTEDDWDIKAWPSLHPDGKFGLHHKRKVKLSDQKYFVQRIRNRDRRFEENPGYVFAAASYVEKRQLQNNANISFSRGKKMKNNDGEAVYTLNDPYTVFDNIKNTPKYWQKFRYEMIAKLENLGPFQWFFTLSCADMKWEENFSSLMRESNIEIEYEVSGLDGSSRTLITFKKDGEKKKLELQDYLKSEIDESLHELIRTNVLNATRNFQHRVDAFIKNIIFGLNNPMQIKNLSYKVEFQGRGAGHIHGVLWANLSKLQKPKKGEENEEHEFEYLTEAFRKLRGTETLKTEEIGDLVKYVDKFVTCSLNPAKLSKMGCSDGAALAKLAEEVQQHRHTRTCRKYDTTCRFHKPTFPMKKTKVFCNELTSEQNKDDSQRKRKPEILVKVKELLDDKVTIDKIMSKYNKKEESLKEYEANRDERIDELLRIAGTNYREYEEEIKHSVKQGYTILLERDIDEGYINAFNPEWLEAWGGNIDLQPCFDYFAVITYVTDYLTKDDSGVTAILREVMKRTEKDETKERMQMLINTFLTHRQMGQAEAYYKLIPSLHMKYSSVKTVFIPTDKKELRSRFLQKVEENENTHDKVAFNVNGREGLFIEKTDVIEKYMRRPGPKNPHVEFTEGDNDLEDLVTVQFVKMFETRQKKDTDDEQELIDMDELDFDDDDIKFHYIMRADETKVDTLLPQCIKLLPKYPGENNFMKKRRFPAAVRFHKKRKDVETHKFFLSELMLYYPFRDEKTDLHSDNEELCAKLYIQEFDNIQKVKQKVMEHLENVEEARYMVEEYLKNESKIEEIGQILDAENEQDLEDCLMEEEENHPDFEHLDPREIDDPNSKTVVREKQFKPIEIGDLEELRQGTKLLDRYQKYVIEIAIRFARGVVKSLKPKNRRPIPPTVMIHGGAGSGKSTVISTLAKWVHYILQRPGDDPDCPYVVISAFTGAAACNVNGQTLHSLFSFNFGHDFITLSDKARDQKRKLFQNLEVLVIDEISLVDSDMLYKIDLRLKEVKQNDNLFGGVALFCFGDLLQIKPVKGRYIFDEPKCESFKIGNAVKSHWENFRIVNLEENHRQGNDKSYADMLNRIRTGNQTEEDIDQLAKRVRPKQHADLKDPDSLWLFGKNKPVDEMNEKRLLQIKGKEFVITAKTFHNTVKNFKPPISKTGAINNTPFQAKLKLKIGAKIMLTYNINTADGLTNGSRGELMGVLRNEQSEITKLIVKLDNKFHGRMKQEATPEITQKYPGGTVIDKVSFAFSLSKSNRGNIATAKVEQFPVKLAFATTAHKIQGQTVKKPQKVIVDIHSVFQPAMAYVMLSRVESIDQLYILEELNETKIYASHAAIQELHKMNKISVNEKASTWLNTKNSRTRISVLNCSSIRPQLEHLALDRSLTISDAICLPESWIWNDEDTTGLELEDFTVHHNAVGRGRGITVYFKKYKFNYIEDITEEKIQLTKLAGKEFELIVVYKAPTGKDSVLASHLERMINLNKTTIVCGDFNMCFIDSRRNKSTSFLLENNFRQLVHEATHIDGGHIDHVYIRSIESLAVLTELYSPYFTAKDHDAMLISFPDTEE